MSKEYVYKDLVNMSKEHMYVWSKNTTLVEILNTLKSTHLADENFLELGRIDEEELYYMAENTIGKKIDITDICVFVYNKVLDEEMDVLRKEYKNCFYLHTIDKVKVHNTKLFIRD